MSTRRKETPISISGAGEEFGTEPTKPPNVPVGVAEWRADTEWQALMEAPPGHEPVVPREEMRKLREVIVDAIDSLSNEDRYIFDSCFITRTPLRLLGQELGWGDPPSFAHTSVARVRDRIVQDLQEKLDNQEMIKQYLKNGRR